MDYILKLNCIKLIYSRSHTHLISVKTLHHEKEHEKCNKIVLSYN